MGVKVHVVFDDQDLIDQCVYIHLYFFYILISRFLQHLDHLDLDLIPV